MTAQVHEKLNQYDQAFAGYRKALNIFSSAFGSALPPVLSPVGAESISLRQHTGTDNTGTANKVVDHPHGLLTEIDGPLCALPLRGMATIMFYERSKVRERV